MLVRLCLSFFLPKAGVKAVSKSGLCMRESSVRIGIYLDSPATARIQGEISCTQT